MTDAPSMTRRAPAEKTRRRPRVDRFFSAHPTPGARSTADRGGVAGSSTGLRGARGVPNHRARRAAWRGDNPRSRVANADRRSGFATNVRAAEQRSGNDPVSLIRS